MPYQLTGYRIKGFYCADYYAIDKIEEHLRELFIKNCSQHLNIETNNIEIKKSESPDYILIDDRRQIGLEITRALDQNLQKAQSIWSSKYKDVSFCPSLLDPEDHDFVINKLQRYFPDIDMQFDYIVLK